MDAALALREDAVGLIMRRNVGVLGLGIIGRRVVTNLRKKGFPVFVWNRTPRPVPNFVGSPAELAQTCEVIQIFVADDDALLRTLQQMLPKIGSRHVIIAHPTVAPDSMRAAAEMVERRRGKFVEAPFTGSRLAAEKGEMVYYVSGDTEALQLADPVLQASSKAIVKIGEIGDATIVKLATNMITAATVQATAEAMALVESSGVSLDQFLAAQRLNATHSGTLELKLPRMIAGDFEVHFSIKHMLKDMQIAMRLARASDLNLPTANVARDALEEQMRAGRGDDDYSAVARKYFSEAGSAAAQAQTLELFGAKEETPKTPAAEKIESPTEDKVHPGTHVGPAASKEESESPAPEPAERSEPGSEGETKAAVPTEFARAETTTTREQAVETSEARRSVFRRWLRRSNDE
jgi:3-hydroxyisobutyrate dehydrogenase-like beta-hydroxyacid dehydrogenase